jgi:hypothetical protein
LANGSPAALLRLQNHGNRTIFYNAWDTIPKYYGTATLLSGETNLDGIRFTGGPADLGQGSNVVFDVVLPTNTLSWKITVACYQPTRKAVTAWRIYSSSIGRFLPSAILGGLFKSTWDHGFEVSTPVITNVPLELVSRPVIPRPH